MWVYSVQLNVYVKKLQAASYRLQVVCAQDRACMTAARCMGMRKGLMMKESFEVGCSLGVDVLSRRTLSLSYIQLFSIKCFQLGDDHFGVFSAEDKMSGYQYIGSGVEKCFCILKGYSAVYFNFSSRL